MTSTTHRESCVVFNTAIFQEKIGDLSDPYIARFAKINRSYIIFHAIFTFILSLELVFFGLLCSQFLQSTAMAFWLAGIFLTVFTYLVLLFYMQGRRPERLMQLRDEFIETIHSCIPFDQGTLEYHCCITKAIVHLISLLKIKNVENRWVQSSETLTYLIEKFRIWTRWKDLLKLKEMLVLTSINEHIRLLKEEPSDLEAHASLAGNYVALATLYQDPKKMALNEELCWEPPEYASDEMHKKFEMALERALEEYHIIDEYAPSDPWVHVQRASLYKELEKPEEEQKEYEQILSIDPSNNEILLRLGKLYFRKGETAKGLKVYDQLRDLDPDKAHDLINQYDAYKVEEYSFE
ncbi:MAG: tetratricopeptide repeat protein [Simkaniaceae bacterium]|nr:tetratricopeptide repeat protein [Candidatus Sacchlamyda saccharinae]